MLPSLFGNLKLQPLAIAMAGLSSAPLLFAETNTTNTDSGQVSQLQTITIQAEKEGNETEGTHSYAAKHSTSATKLNLSLKDTPQTVQVLTQQYLDDRNLTSLQDVFSTITGVTTSQVDERQSVFARGFQVDYYLIDGLPSTINMGSNDLDLGIYDRVEIIKGASGLTTGAGSPAMAINLIRKHANARTLTGNIATSLGSWNDWSSSADLSAPLNQEGNLRGRVYVKHSDTDSFMDYYHKERNVFYSALDYDLSDQTSFYLAATYQELKRQGVRWGGTPAFYTDETRTDFSRSLNISAPWTYWNQNDAVVFAGMKHNLWNDINLNVAYTWRQTDMDTQLLYVGGKADKATNTSSLSDVSVWKAEQQNVENNVDVYINAPFTLFDQPQEIIIGGSWNRNEATKYKYGGSYYAGGASHYLANNINYNNMNNPLLQDVVLQPGTYAGYPNQTTQSSIYLSSRLQWTDHLKTIAGVRSSNWKFETDTGNANRTFNQQVTPYFGIIYDLNPTYSVYASYTDIFKPQTYKQANGSYLDPIVGKQYETGIKGAWLDQRLNASFAVFRIQQDNEATLLLNADGSNVHVNNSNENAYYGINGAKHEGFELDLNGELTEHLSILAGIAHFQARANGVEVNPTNSRSTADLFLTYHTGAWKLGGGLNYKSKIYTGSGANLIEQGGVTIANLMLGYQFDSNFSVQGNIENLFDKKYYAGIGANAMNYGDPRNASLTLRYTF